MTAVTRAVAAQQDTPEAQSPRSTTSPVRSPPRSSFDSDVANQENGASEKPVREQLKRASIAVQNGSAEAKPPLPGNLAVTTELAGTKPSVKETQDKPQPRRKRSFEELEEGNGSPVVPTATKHIRKRSREVVGGSTNGEDEAVSESSSRDLSPDGSTTKPEAPREHISSLQHKESALGGSKKDTNAADSETVASTADSASISVAEDVATKSADVEQETVQPPSARGIEEVTAEGPLPTTVKQSGKESSQSKPAPTTNKDDAVAFSKSVVSGGFGNSSTESPFGALAASKSTNSPPQTSASAFASSGFASLANSTQSAFGALAPKTSVFGSNKTESTQSVAPPSGFASLAKNASASPFGNLGGGPSVFGGGSGSKTFGSGLGSSFGAGTFGSSFGGGAPLSSFASPAGSSVLGGSKKSVRPLGSLADDGEEDLEAGDVAENEPELGAQDADDATKDERFYEQDVETGEEHETTMYQVRGKLYVSVEKQWKERGSGNVRINVSNPAEDTTADKDDIKRTARFVMRADGSHRIVLNSAVKKEIRVEDPSGGAPKGKTVCFLGFEDGKPILMQLKLKTNAQAMDIYNTIRDIQEDL